MRMSEFEYERIGLRLAKLILTDFVLLHSSTANAIAAMEAGDRYGSFTPSRVRGSDVDI